MKVIARNKKAFFNYEIVETFEAGISLMGSEVKSIRDGRVSLKESYAEVRDGEVFLVSCHISPFPPANRMNHEPLRERKLLLNAVEIKRLQSKVMEKGLTLVPLSLYLKGRLVKLELGVGRGKKLVDKRDDIKKRDQEREIHRAIKGND